MKLQVYADRVSSPSRAVLLFCKLNGIDFEEKTIELSKGEHLSPEYAAINPMKQVPAIVVDDEFKLNESQAIIKFLVEAFPQVADHWYPKELFKRAQINSILAWYHTNLRRGTLNFVIHSTFAPVFGLPLDPEAAAEDEKVLSGSLAHIESFWLKGDGPFLLGSSQPSIADLGLACEIMELEVVDDGARERILSPHQKILKWIDATKNATQPYFDEFHALLPQVKQTLQNKI
ncbi:OLC1v1029676C4 [Oldenlandia corymbosa var. corymbosa]|uniref:glutathione transferase n=1 Tax=Oldenlandia corymbosa var. corymbosa TaxID=529605 RepID=A0AAV1CEB8_OLDCO|nr:OLC1v1029676C4 [Oldenlandia corymbosa var. corymbosa]